MNESNHPELHVNEEPRNDFSDVLIGFGGMFTFMIVVAIIFTVIEIMTR